MGSGFSYTTIIYKYPSDNYLYSINLFLHMRSDRKIIAMKFAWQSNRNLLIQEEIRDSLYHFEQHSTKQTVDDNNKQGNPDINTRVTKRSGLTSKGSQRKLLQHGAKSLVPDVCDDVDDTVHSNVVTACFRFS